MEGPGTSDKEGDLAISRVGVTKSPPAPGLVEMGEVEAKVRVTTIVTETGELSIEAAPAMAFPSYSLKEKIAK